MHPPKSTVFVTGIIRPNDAPPLCREGADFLVHAEAFPLAVRLQPAAEEVRRRLESAAAGGELVVVSGHARRSIKPGCDYVEVWAVEALEVFVERQKAA